MAASWKFFQCMRLVLLKSSSRPTTTGWFWSRLKNSIFCSRLSSKMWKSLASRLVTNLFLRSVTVTGTMTSLTATLIFAGGACGKANHAAASNAVTVFCGFDTAVTPHSGGWTHFSLNRPAGWKLLALHAPGAVALQQGFHFVHAEAVEIAGDGVLQTTRRHGELERLLMARHGLQAVDQAAGEGIAAS